jgi:hypothetical protein
MRYPQREDLFGVHIATYETTYVLRETADERIRQVTKWGVQTRPDGTGGGITADLARITKHVTDAAAADGSLTWRHILDEEVLEAFAETDQDKLRTELIQVAAVAISWVEDIDRKAEAERSRAAAEGASVDRAIAEGRLPLGSPGRAHHDTEARR